MGKEQKTATQPQTTRLLGLDITRSIAISLVLLIHAMGLSIDGYSMPLVGIDGFIRIYLRRLSFSCVPLFLMLSGFLNVHKTDCLKLWRKSFPHIALSYLFWGIWTILFGVLCLGEVFSLDSVINIFTYSLPRAWYINMYMGFLVLMPFVNICWVNMQKREKKILLTALFLISFVSKYIFSLSMKWLPSNPLMLISNYFFNAYYIFYYLVGAYVHDHPVCIKKVHIAVLWQFILCVHTGYYYLMSGGGYYNDISDATNFWYDNPALAVESILLFLICYNIEVKNNLLRKAVSKISLAAFDMYLVSYIFDMTAWKHLSFLYYKIPYYFALLGCFAFSFCCSFVSALFKRYLAGKIKSVGKVVGIYGKNT